MDTVRFRTLRGSFRVRVSLSPRRDLTGALAGVFLYHLFHHHLLLLLVLRAFPRFGSSLARGARGIGKHHPRVSALVSVFGDVVRVHGHELRDETLVRPLRRGWISQVSVFVSVRGRGRVRAPRRAERQRRVAPRASSPRSCPARKRRPARRCPAPPSGATAPTGISPPNQRGPRRRGRSASRVAGRRRRNQPAGIPPGTRATPRPSPRGRRGARAAPDAAGVERVLCSVGGARA